MGIYIVDENLRENCECLIYCIYKMGTAALIHWMIKLFI